MGVEGAGEYLDGQINEIGLSEEKNGLTHLLVIRCTFSSNKYFIEH